MHRQIICVDNYNFIHLLSIEGSYALHLAEVERQHLDAYQALLIQNHEDVMIYLTFWNRCCHSDYRIWSSLTSTVDSCYGESVCK